MINNLFRYSCRTIRPELWDFVAERLPEGPLEKVETHLAKCLACRKEVSTLKLAQNALLDARLEEPPAPQRGWADLQMRLGQPETGVRTASRVTPVANAWETDRQTQRTLSLRRAPNLMLMGSCAMLLLSTFVTYRALSVQHEAVAPMPVFLNPHKEAVKTEPKTTNSGIKAQRNEDKKTLTQEPIFIAASAQKELPRKDTKQKQFVKKSPEQPSNEVPGYQLMPAGYQDNPEINIPAPTTSALKFSKHTPDPSERTQNAQKEPEYIMGTLTPAAHEKDAY